MSLEQEVKDGNRAKNIIDDPIFKDAYDQIEEAIIDKLKSSDLVQEDVIYALVCSLQTHSEGRKQLERVMQTGDLAEAQVAK